MVVFSQNFPFWLVISLFKLVTLIILVNHYEIKLKSLKKLIIFLKLLKFNLFLTKLLTEFEPDHNAL